ncbi:hypothetical protein UT300019_18230 [Clostridium sp. CTA-19]
MYKFYNSILINKSIDEVFNIFSNLKFLSVIWDYILDERKDYTNLKEGLKVKFALLNNKNKIDLELMVMDIEKNQYFSILNKKNGAKVSYRYNFIEKENATEIKYVENVHLESFHEELAEQIFEIIKDEDYNHLLKVKAYLEA